jgi:hypothetical protein
VEVQSALVAQGPPGPLVWQRSAGPAGVAEPEQQSAAEKVKVPAVTQAQVLLVHVWPVQSPAAVQGWPIAAPVHRFPSAMLHVPEQQSEPVVHRVSGARQVQACELQLPEAHWLAPVHTEPTGRSVHVCVPTEQAPVQQRASTPVVHGGPVTDAPGSKHAHTLPWQFMAVQLPCPEQAHPRPPELHAGLDLQKPPWQLPEQQSVLVLQTRPSLMHTHLWLLAMSQAPEQQSAFCVQATPPVTHVQ